MPDNTDPGATDPNQPTPNEPEAPFSEPWHAQLFAVTHTLASSGRFDWPDWADHFAAALKHADDASAPKDGSAYYDIWLSAFEDFLIDRGLADTTGLADFKRGWTEAYTSTPHGQPVELDR
jgi:nitrile hydratase accessory protein